MRQAFCTYTPPATFQGGNIVNSFALVMDPRLLDALRGCTEDVAVIELLKDPINELTTRLNSDDKPFERVKSAEPGVVAVIVHAPIGVLLEEAWVSISKALREHAATLGLQHDHSREVLSAIKPNSSGAPASFKGTSRRLS